MKLARMALYATQVLVAFLGRDTPLVFLQKAPNEGKKVGPIDGFREDGAAEAIGRMLGLPVAIGRFVGGKGTDGLTVEIGGAVAIGLPVGVIATGGPRFGGGGGGAFVVW